MYTRWLLTFLLCLINFNSLKAFEQELLKPNDVDRIMEQILSQHVETKAVTSKIVRNAIAVFINQFDPHRIYLLQSEVDPYADLSEREVNQVIQQYKKNDFTIFKNANLAIQKSILRSRSLREKIEQKEKEKLFVLNIPTLKEIAERPFARNEDELKSRLLENLEIFVGSYKNRFGEASTAQKKEYILKSYENQLREFENQYLYQDDQGNPFSEAEKENLFTIHVLKALASSLDSHTTFYQANEAYDMRVRLQKEFQGIGLVLRDKGDEVVVARTLEGSPAARSGLIEPEDQLLEVNGKEIANYPFEKVMEMLHGEKDVQVKLLFKRRDKGKKGDKIFSVSLLREEIILSNDRVDMSSEPFGNGIIGKITLHSFYQGDGVSSEKDVRDAIDKLKKQGNLRGLILDLRENSGGFLSQAVKVAGLFITNGVIVISKYSNGEERFYRDVDGETSYDGPLVVLTSKATASAAEIVAQALQDYGVAVIVGDEHTYGKGTIQTQTVTDNKSTSYFKVTVGKYYTVSGKTPQKNGVKADIVAPGKWSKEEIGEIYLDSVGADTIPPSYDDSLSDVSADVKGWYLKYYIPTLQHRVYTWDDLLPTLRKNSVYRIKHNKNYQLFLTGKVPKESGEEEEEQFSDEKKPKTFGVDDLQMAEAVSVIKDMVLLHTLDRSKAKN
ncbi:MAG: PDZ domain-containing protein [Candidatus Protochlamydia sp.]|nr:PDZ domain-containing protein [Candidatus Protochlamydia sp.]